MEPIFMTPFLSRKHSIMNYVGWCRVYANKGAKNHSNDRDWRNTWSSVLRSCIEFAVEYDGEGVGSRFAPFFSTEFSNSTDSG